MWGPANYEIYPLSSLIDGTAQGSRPCQRSGCSRCTQQKNAHFFIKQKILDIWPVKVHVADPTMVTNIKKEPEDIVTHSNVSNFQERYEASLSFNSFEAHFWSHGGLCLSKIAGTYRCGSENGGLCQSKTAEAFSHGRENSWDPGALLVPRIKPG